MLTFDDMQSDITGLLDSNNNEVVTYTYDNWGKLLNIGGSLADTVGVINPLRYRGYYYDTETGLFYVVSRYYNPELGRFISRDEPSYEGDKVCAAANLYAYANDNPIKYSDPDGHSATYSGIVGFGIQIVLSANIGCFQGYIGVEALWFAFTGNNNFKNGIMPWCYYFVGGSMGSTLDFSRLLNPNLFINPKNVLKGFGLNFSFSLSVAVFVITANKMRSPNDYNGSFYFWSGTVWGVTVSKASGGAISTYGIGVTWQVGISKWKISVGKELFGILSGYSYYRPIRIGANAQALYGIAKRKHG